MEISFIVPVEPVRLPRPSTNGKQRYLPGKVKAYKRTVGFAALAAMRGMGGPFTGSVLVSMVFTMKMPKKGKAPGQNHVSDPDLSNLIKAAEDGMNGIVYVDDCQISYLSASKVYGLTPSVHITVRTL